MSFSSGTYTLVAGNPVVTGTSISSTWANNTLDDIATALSTCLLKDGTQTATAKVPFAVGIDVTTEITTTSVTFTAFAGATTSLTIGGTGATSTVAIPGTLDATSSTAASLKTAGGIAAAKAANIGTTLTVGTTSVLTQGFSTTSGICYIGDTANTKMTLGLTINQGAADNEVFAVKSSDVSHAMTGQAEADTYGTIKKAHVTGGGIVITGFKANSADIGAYGIKLQGAIGETVDTTKSTAGGGAVHIDAVVTDGGTGVTGVGADGNLMAISTNSTTRFIFDSEGSAHADVEWVAFDKFDDVEMLDSLNSIMTGRQDLVKNEFGKWLSEHRESLQREKIVNFYDDGPRAMLNTTRLAMLHTGAIRQLGKAQGKAAARLRRIEGKLLQIERRT